MTKGHSDHHDADAAAEAIAQLQHTHALVGDSSFSAMVARFHAQFGELLNRGEAEEIIDWLRDEGLMGGGRALQKSGVPQWMAKFHKILRYIKKHPNNNAIYAVLHIWDEPVLDDINGNLSQTQFADRLYPSSKPVNPAKAAVNNAVIDAQKHFGTPPRRDQRQAAARATMSAVRIERLEATGKN